MGEPQQDGRGSKVCCITAFVAAVAICIVVPVLEFVPTVPEEQWTPAVWLVQSLTFAWLLTAGFLIRTLGKAAVLALTWIGGVYYGLIYLRIAYQLYMGTTFDVRFATDSLSNVPSTIIRTLGWRLALLLLALAAGMWLVQRLLQSIINAWPSGRQIPRLIVLTGLTLILIRLPHQRFGYVEPVLISLIEIARGETAKLPLWPRIPGPNGQLGNGQNLIFLQLESVNSAAGFGRITAGGHRYDEQYMPELEKLSRRGLLIPYFWANNVQTARALATVLCGTTGNAGPPLSYNLDMLRQACLPAILDQSDYTSLYFNGFADQDFDNLRRFADRLGFDQLNGKEILKPGDPIAEWGFEECTFYQRVFEALRERYPDPERMFIYIAVSRHHIPYRTDPTKTAIHKIKDANTALEFYLNSLSEQDVCLATFWDEYSRYAAGNSHLFVFGDHSVALDLDVPTEHRSLHVTNFLTPMLYVAPGASERGDQPAEAPVQRVAGQADLASTALELLALGVGANSLAGLLEGGEAEDFEACQVLAQPYGEPAVIVIRDTDKYAYVLDEKTVLSWKIVDQVEESDAAVVTRDISYEEFLSEYGCERYRRNLESGTSEISSE